MCRADSKPSSPVKLKNSMVEPSAEILEWVEFLKLNDSFIKPGILVWLIDLIAAFVSENVSFRLFRSCDKLRNSRWI